MSLDSLSPRYTDRRRIEVIQRQLKRRGGGLDLTIDLRWVDAWRDPAGQEPTSWNAAWLFVKYRQLVMQEHGDETSLLAHVTADESEHPPLRKKIEQARQQGLTSLQLTRHETVQSLGGNSHAHQESHAREVIIQLSSHAANKLSYSSQTWSDWQHARLDRVTTPSSSGATNALAEDKLGVFIYRSAPGGGPAEMRGIRLRWLSDEPSPIQVWVHALEMIYIPQGAFDLGDPGDPERDGAPRNGFHRSKPARGKSVWTYRVKSEKKIKVVEPGATENGLTWDSASYGSWGDIPRAFPKGHQAFYCMRTQLTQGQFADFMNSLSGAAKTAHFPYGGQGDYRYTVFKTDSGQRFATRPGRACNWVSWGDFIAYTWWAGLRPLTELEWEKACRGSAAAVSNEYAWGTTKLVRTNVILGDEAGVSIATGNGHLDNATNPLEGGDGGYGPVADDAFLINGGITGPSHYQIGGERVPADQREATGASYYGVMGMSGNLWDYVISAGAEEGRRFSGVNGNGTLTDTGEPDWGMEPPPWPGVDGRGSGFRGGSWYTATNRGQTADRTSACGLPGYVFRSHDTGIRAGRTAPAAPTTSSKKKRKM